MAIPEVTVLLPVFNGERHLKEAVDSVLGEEGNFFELLVVDDGSTDRSAEILNSYRDRRLNVLRLPQNQGLVQALNLGLAQAQGSLIARMDADDMHAPARLKRQAARLRRSGASICFGRYTVIGNGKPVRWRESAWAKTVWRGLFENAYGAHPTCMFVKSDVLAIGGYDPDFRCAEDYDLWDRCLAQGLRFSYYPGNILMYRLHDGSVTATLGGTMQESAKKVSERALARQFPDMTAPERAALRFLLLGDKTAGEADVALGLQNLEMRVRDFVSRHGNEAFIFRDVIQRLSRRLSELGPPSRKRASAIMKRLSLCSFSPSHMARAFRA